MSFITGGTGTTFEAGFFLAADEKCVRKTATIADNHAQKVVRNGRTIVPAGAVIPANGATAKGILYEDIDVTEGAAPGSIVVEGTVYGDLLPAALASAAANALTGIRVIATAPAVERPDYYDRDFGTLTVESAAGTASGDTAITVSGYTPEDTDTYAYKVGDTAETPAYGETLSGWTAWDGDDDITAATGKKITVAVLTADGYVVAHGSATVTANA